MTFAFRAALAAALCAPLLTSGAQDSTMRGVRIGLTYDPGTKPGIIVLPVTGANGDSVRAIVERDLDFSDRFVVVKLDASSASTFRQANGTPNFPLFSRLGAAAVVQAAVTPSGMRVILYDVAKQVSAGSRDFALASSGLGRDWRLGVHAVSDVIEEWITGQRGIAATRIAFVRGDVIRVIDSDGAFDTALPAAANAISPSWHPNGSMIAYATFGAQSRIHLLDLRTGRSRPFGATPSRTNITPIFSPDGGSIAYAHSGENGSDIYIFSMSGNGEDARRISVGRGTDNTNPSFNPDGRRMVFTTGRLGHPELYLMDVDGSNPELLTTFDFGDQNYRSDPDWSPDGRLIAFQSRMGGRFQVLTLNLRDRSTKRLTDDGDNEQPSWAPDGRHLVFTSTRSGRRELWVVDVESGRMRQLTHAASSMLGAWSPRLGGQ